MKRALYIMAFLTTGMLLVPVITNAQTPVIDSLKNRVRVQVTGEKKLETVFLLCDKYSSLHPDTLAAYLSMARQMINGNGSLHKKAELNYFEAIYKSRTGQIDSARRLIEENILHLNKDPESLFLLNKFRLALSNLYMRQNRQKDAIENSLQILHAAEINKDITTQIKAKTSIGWGYMELGQNREALNWFNDAVNDDRLSGKNLNPPVLYSNMAAVYNELNKNDSAEIIVTYAIKLAQEQNDLTSLVNAYYIYSDICVDKGDNNKAENLLQQGLAIRKQIGDPFYIVSDITQMGIFYAHNHQTQKGIDIINEGIAMAVKYDLAAKIPILYEALAANYKTAGDFVKYSETLENILSLKDSLYQKNSAEVLGEIQTKYEVQKQENTIIQQKFELTKKNNLFYGLLLVLVVTLVLGYVAFQIRKKTQQLKLQQLMIEQKIKTTAAVMQAEENERKRIAEDLHDSVAQKMVVAKLNLEAFGNYLPDMTNEQRKIFDNISSLVEDAAAEVRNLSHNMLPEAFFRSGLTDAVKNFINKIDNKDLAISFNAEGSLDTIDKNKEIMIFRILQECIQNVLKHANGTRLDISLIAENDEIDIIVEDNGVGFNTASIDLDEGLGMKSIRSRTDFLNGRLEVNSRPGIGTVIAFYIPLK